jgi:hypothetical protein
MGSNPGFFVKIDMLQNAGATCAPGVDALHARVIFLSARGTSEDATMTFKPRARTALAAACTALTIVMVPAKAAEIPVVTGEQWTTSTDQVKKAYLVGIANMAQVENAYFARNPPNESQSFVPRLAKGLQGQTLDSVRQGVDSWYAANPTKLKRPVLDIIWFEMAVPGLQKNK